MAKKKKTEEPALSEVEVLRNQVEFYKKKAEIAAYAAANKISLLQAEIELKNQEELKDAMKNAFQTEYVKVKVEKKKGT